MVRAVDSGGVIDKICITETAIEAEFNSPALGHSQVAALAKHLAAQIPAIHPESVIGAITYIRIAFRRCLNIGTYAAIPDKIHLGPQQFGNQFCGCQFVLADSKALFNLRCQLEGLGCTGENHCPLG